LGWPKAEHPFPQANSWTRQDYISDTATNQEGQGIINYAYFARDYQQSLIVAITTRVLKRSQQNK
jgi:hypothetical protein